MKYNSLCSEALQHPKMAFLPQPNYFNLEQRTKDVLKFYGPSFHQQHDLAKQWFALLLFSMHCMVMVLKEK